MAKPAALADLHALWQRRGLEIYVTLAGMAGLILIAALCGWMGARPINPVKGPKLVPWRFLMVLAGAVAWLVGRHALSLAGLIPDQ